MRLSMHMTTMTFQALENNHERRKTVKVYVCIKEIKEQTNYCHDATNRKDERRKQIGLDVDRDAVSFHFILNRKMDLRP